MEMKMEQQQTQDKLSHVDLCRNAHLQIARLLVRVGQYKRGIENNPFSERIIERVLGILETECKLLTYQAKEAEADALVLAGLAHVRTEEDYERTVGEQAEEEVGS